MSTESDTPSKMRTYRKIHILFADEEPAEAYSDESLAQTVLERCEEWSQKTIEIDELYVTGKITLGEYHDKMETHYAAHPISSALANTEDYALKTVFLHE